MLLLFPIALAGIALLAERADPFATYVRHTQSFEVPDQLLQSGRTLKEVRLLEYDPDKPFRAARFSRGESAAEAAANEVARKAAAASGLPVVSVVADEADLYSQRSGILANRDERGRKWERPALVSIYNNGNQMFQGGAGLRLHGGTSREMEKPSFRLHLRPLYGHSSVAENVLFGGNGDPVTSVIVHNDGREYPGDGGEWRITRYANSMAFDIVTRIGGIAPMSMPASFFLNGEYMGPYVLHEKISSDFLRARFGDGDYEFARSKNSPDPLGTMKEGDPEAWNNLRDKIRKLDAPLTRQQANEIVNIENMVNWFISVLVTGSTDPYQGAIVRQTDAEDSRWFWINWDMDHAFRDAYTLAPPDQPWEVDLLLPLKTAQESNAGQTLLNPKRVRGLLFLRLSAEAPEFRAYFLRRLVDVLNHEVTAGFMSELVQQYDDVARSFGVADRAFIENVDRYLAHRPAVVRGQVSRHFTAGPAYRVDVDGIPAGCLNVDGYPVSERFVGWYFGDTPIRLDVDKDCPTYDFSWQQDGELRQSTGMQLSITPGQDTRISIGHRDNT